ncbi:MAG: sigma-70 family RNA polymerase sigma factor [Thermoguttaceae bacterium]|nr:sigma-70 family RNA polymerase sigma factor [Thermoguttaceae bacterium]MBR0191518.1 sigma-70 family RNA polymerase sigma factor [Thermoguttaceae bacterium]
MHLEPTDFDLVQTALKGDAASFGELVRRFQTGILRFFLLHHRLDDAQDLTQETFLAAWKSLRTYNPKWKFSTWILAIAHQQNALFFRNLNHSIRPKVVDPGEDFQMDIMEQPIDHAEFKELEDAENAENLWNRIRQNLPKDQAEVLWFFYVEEKSQQEIAQITDRSVSGVKSILFRAREALRKIL